MLSEAELTRFWNKVEFDPNSGCWLWSGSSSSERYGKMRCFGGFMPAHRLSWIIHFGEISPSSLFVCHKCDTPRCVNPAHLFLGTHADNMRDMKNKNRAGALDGSDVWAAKLTEDHLPHIVELMWKDISNAEISRRFGVSPNTISVIQRGRGWKKTLSRLRIEPPKKDRSLRKLTPDQAASAVERLRQGEPRSRIAKDLGISPGYVSTLGCRMAKKSAPK